MSRRAQENIVAVAILAVLLGIIWMSLGYGPRARMVPLPVAIFGVVLVVIQLVWQNLPRSRELSIDLVRAITKRSEDEIAPAREGEAAAAPDAQRVHGGRREAVAYGLVAAFLALLLAFGPIVAAALFTFGYFKASGQYGWLRSALYAGVFTGALYLLFVAALDVELYHGLLEPLMRR
jgi:hypothetical protein